jgi:SAM-dependent methyltransferase
VWATDLWFNATQNYRRIRDAGVEDGVFPIHADARALPYADEFFDAIMSIDSLHYFGTDDFYLNYLARFVKPEGPIGFAGAGFVRDIDDDVPLDIRAWWTQEGWLLHSATWWRRHWERPGIVDIDVADTMPEGWKNWLAWHWEIAPDNAVEIAALEADAGRTMGYVRIVARRRAGVDLLEHVTSVPSQYTKAPLLRDGA